MPYCCGLQLGSRRPLDSFQDVPTSDVSFAVSSERPPQFQSAFLAKGHPMKLADIPPGSDLAYRCAAKQIADQVEFELETCRRLLGTEPEKVFALLAITPNYTVFLDDHDL